MTFFVGEKKDSHNQDLQFTSEFTLGACRDYMQVLGQLNFHSIIKHINLFCSFEEACPPPRFSRLNIIIKFSPVSEACLRGIFINFDTSESNENFEEARIECLLLGLYWRP
jgi:hypothetical protein